MGPLAALVRQAAGVHGVGREIHEGVGEAPVVITLVGRTDRVGQRLERCTERCSAHGIELAADRYRAVLARAEVNAYGYVTPNTRKRLEKLGVYSIQLEQYLTAVGVTE